MSRNRRPDAPADLPVGAKSLETVLPGVVVPVKPKRTKHGNIRTEYGGRMYDSIREAVRAKELDAFKAAGLIVEWLPQVTIPLGPDHKYRVDFLVYWVNRDLIAEDVKGHETERFRKSKKLWAKYMTIPLHVIKNGKVTETITGKGTA